MGRKTVGRDERLWAQVVEATFTYFLATQSLTVPIALAARVQGSRTGAEWGQLQRSWVNVGRRPMEDAVRVWKQSRTKEDRGPAVWPVLKLRGPTVKSQPSNQG